MAIIDLAYEPVVPTYEINYIKYLQNNIIEIRITNTELFFCFHPTEKQYLAT